MIQLSLLIPAVFFVTVLASLQAWPQTTRRSAGTPPRYLNMVHQDLKPGRNTEYDRLLAAIADGFARARITAYWVEFEFSQEKTLALNFLDSLEEQDKIISALGSGYAAHPDLVQMADRLLAENVSNVNSVLGKRLDDLGYRWDAIDFAKTRILLVTTISVRPGHDTEFTLADTERAAAHRKSNSDAAWVVYQACYGSAQPTYIILTPYASFRQMDEALAQDKAIETAGTIVAEHIRQAAQSAFASVESHAFFATPRCSHVPDEFAAGDSEFWAPKSAKTPAPGRRN